jgi:hypothetical protein
LEKKILQQLINKYMPNQFYSPNSKITGGAAFFSFNSKDGSVYVKLLKQVANNANKKGNFDGANPINIKLSQDEAADIIRAIRTSGEAKFFHKFDASTTSGSFRHYTIPNTTPVKSGFGLSVKKNSEGKDIEVKVGFTLASAERLSLYLNNALTHIFDAEYSADLKEAKEYRDKKTKVETATEQTTEVIGVDSKELQEPEIDF